MSSICPKCGKQIEGDVCKSCQTGNTKQNNEKKTESKVGEMNIVSGIFFGFVALLIITLSCWVYSYGNHVFAEIAAERAERKAAQECCEDAFTHYENGSYYESLNLIVNEYNVNHRGVLPEKDSKVDKLYNDIEKDLYEGIKSYDSSSPINKLALDACNDYIEYYPNGKHISEAKSIKDEILNGHKYADCIVVENGVAYYDMTLKTFISNYNKTIDNSDETDLVKAFMKLNTNPARTTTSDGYYAYDVTNTAVSTNRAAVSMSITVGKNSKIVSVNFTIPSGAGVNTDISDSLMRSVATLTSPTSSLSSSEFDTMASNLIDYGSAYHKGIFMGSYSSSGYRTYRLGALTEESYNDIK